MDIKDAERFAGWYASYMDCDQGRSLIECLQAKIKQQQELLDNIIGEIELTESPREETPRTVLCSVKSMIEQKEEIKVTRGHFGWLFN